MKTVECRQFKVEYMQYLYRRERYRSVATRPGSRDRKDMHAQRCALRAGSAVGAFQNPMTP